jgi:hypothetical protein
LALRCLYLCTKERSSALLHSDEIDSTITRCEAEALRY